ncbi:DUF2182 domain-containing protein [Pelagibius litoralis]|uniref:DUF2182 domain-containing protein n=1 Tax=Pelagibius litoralis TaxID=374515 RepID=A0A967KB81_9PROT|nr:DUF2182 domain-containing protein [Pelagibius litoralis]NIA70932.1 DUF2182 domain-containing protein [Pelagibius litoralis]
MPSAIGPDRSPYFRNGALLLAGLLTAGWGLTLWSITHMDAPLVRLMMPLQSAWSAQEVFLVWLMWAVMMGAMMLPSAVPMILIHRRVAGSRQASKAAATASLWFIFAYLMVWSCFSAAAAASQWGLQSAGLLSPMLVIREPWLAGCVLIAAGVVQWTPLKQVCLKKCRTPIGFLITEWRKGRLGALIMGTKHGAYCVGCCWALMALLFVLGVMNLAAILALTSIVAIEKLAPFGERLGQWSGAGLVAWGIWLLAF